VAEEALQECTDEISRLKNILSKDEQVLSVTEEQRGSQMQTLGT